MTTNATTVTPLKIPVQQTNKREDIEAIQVKSVQIWRK